MEIFSQQEGLLDEFDEGLFFALADVITIYHDGRVVVRFRDGVEIEPSPISSSKTAYSAHFAMNALSWLAKLCGMQMNLLYRSQAMLVVWFLPYH